MFLTRELGAVLPVVVSLTGCLSDHCEVYPEHCVGAADTDTSASQDETDESDSGSEGSMLPEAPTLELNFSQVKQFEFSWAPVLDAQHYQLLESPEEGDFVQIGGDLAGESIALTMPLHFRWNASYKLLACNAEGCSESSVVDVVDNLVEAIGYFKASNPGANDEFGRCIAMSRDGDTLVVGAHEEGSSATGIDGAQDNEEAIRAGAVYVFIRNGAVWSQHAYVKASNTDSNDRFGCNVALSSDGNTLAVGAGGEASNATTIDGSQTDNSSPGAGAVYVFVRNQGIWSQQAFVKASNTDAGDTFGIALALSNDGSTLAVGAINEDSNAVGVNNEQSDDTALSSGSAYVFVRDGSSWSQQAYIKPSNTDSYDQFGRSIALAGDGNTLAVGAMSEASSASGINNQAGELDNSAPAAGAGYVFVRNGTIWSQQAYIKASNADANDNFGLSVALSNDGNTLAIGAPHEDGSAVAVDEDRANDSTPDAGAIYVFLRTGGAWSQQSYIKAPNTHAEDQLGFSVALSSDGNTLLGGANNQGGGSTGIGDSDDDNSANQAGAAYVFIRNGVVWSQYAYVKASNTGDYDNFGFSVVISGDASTLAIGAYEEGSAVTGIGGDQTDDSAPGAGAVYLY